MCCFSADLIMTAHTVYCRGCQHAWIDDGGGALAHLAGWPETGADCACTCSEPADPRYEDWVTDPDPEDVPLGAWGD